MTLKISKKSWHYRLVAYAYGKKSMATSSCGYWADVFAALFSMTPACFLLAAGSGYLTWTLFQWARSLGFVVAGVLVLFMVVFGLGTLALTMWGIVVTASLFIEHIYDPHLSMHIIRFKRLLCKPVRYVD